MKIKAAAWHEKKEGNTAYGHMEFQRTQRLHPGGYDQ